MRSLSIMYHDVVENGNYPGSGFPGKGADLYKLDRQEFARHLEAIRPVASPGLHLTFDDGGVSSQTIIAGMLEQYGWHGYFFVTTDWIGRPGFLNEDQIRELDLRGHTIGSHSCSHPTRMSHIAPAKLLTEWRGSITRLEAIVGHPVKVASIPGGYYARSVAETAAQSGIETLFTSEPTTAVHVVNGCKLLGRYVILRGMGPEWSGGFAAGKLRPRVHQALLWNAKRVAKMAGGELYLRAREAILRRA